MAEPLWYPRYRLFTLGGGTSEQEVETGEE